MTAAHGGGAALVRCVLLMVVVLGLAACQDQSTLPDRQRVVGGDPERGHEAIVAIGCGACHQIPGVQGARGIVGPALHGFGQRKLIGGVLPNDPTTLTRWIEDAPSLIPETGMPDLPLSQDQARDIAAYLYTLR